MKKIDIHIHADSTERARETLDFLQEQDVRCGILMSMGEQGNDLCRAICAQEPALRWNCNFDEGDPAAVFDKMAACKEAGAVGVGELCINKRMDAPILESIFSAAEQLELPVLFHMSPEEGFNYGIVDDPGLPLLEETLRRHPHLKLIGHSQPFWMEISADAPTDREGRNGRGEGPVLPGGRVPELLRRYPNLYADISAGSGYFALTRDEEFGLRFCEEFQDRLLFGTDTFDIHSPWKIMTWKWLEDKHAAGRLSDTALRKICHENAERLYGPMLPDREDVIVTDTPCGPVKGRRTEAQQQYLGIPYASAQRFAYPEVTTRWDGVLDATEPGKCCWQFRAFRSEATGQDPFYWHEFREGIRFTYGDDCQRLNIYAPAQTDGQKLPVIVFIHGGAFLGGSSVEKHLAPPAWPEQGVIAVTMNYRLGPFGFLCTTDGLKEAGHTGNYGLYDQLAALQWLRANIAAFGGDPERITLMGQSAGCMCVQELCLSDLTRGLIAGAVLCSGAGLSPTFDANRRMEDNLAFGDAVMAAAGCSTLAELRKKGAWETLKAFGQVLATSGTGLAGTSPVVDGRLVPCSVSEGIRTGKLHGIPYLLCSTSEDLWQPELFHAIGAWRKAAAEQGVDRSYAAYLARQLPGDARGAFHSADLWYWFGTLGNSWRPFTAWDRELSDRMQRYLIHFAACGDPNGESLPPWPGYAQAPGQVMLLGDDEAGCRDADSLL